MLRLAAMAALEVVEQPGLLAVLPSDGAPRGGVLLRTVAAADALDDVLGRGTPQWIAVLPDARPCLTALQGRGWDRVQEHTAMSLDDLAALPEPALPVDLRCEPVAVRRGAAGYPLEEALRVAVDYGDPLQSGAGRDLEVEARLLRELSGIRLFAAVAGDGSCVATAGSRVVDSAALVASVATVPAQRGRGTGTAMTAVALRAAAEAGAVEAYLDATPAGVGIYRRLGFEEVGPVVYCERSQR